MTTVLDGDSSMTFLKALVPLLLVCLCSCGSPPEVEASLYTFKKGYMGTEFTIRAWAAESEESDLKAAVDAAFDEIYRLEMIFSDYQMESEVTRLIESPKVGQANPVSAEMADVIEKSLALSRETDGAFDITVAPMIRLWRMARKNHQLPNEKQMTAARERSGYEKLKLSSGPAVTFTVENMRLDFGGIVKGVAADRALEVLREKGFPRSLVAASGDIALGDAPPHEKGWRIGIETLGSELTGTVLLENAAVSTSGDTRQYVEIDGVRYSHIVDPQTGLGLTERIGVTVIAPNATTTDSHATAVSILGAEKGLQFIESKPDIECVIVKPTKDGGVEKIESPGMKSYWVE